MIQTANSYTTRLFGHHASHLERRSISTLLPPPFSAAHDVYMRRYLETGVGRAVDYTRVVLGLHKHGHIFPILLAVREAALPDGSLSFVGIMRAMSCSEQHVILDSNHRIMACSLESFGLLGFQPQALASEADRPCFEDWVAEWGSVQDALTREGGTTILVTPPATVGAAAHSDSRAYLTEHADDGVWIHAYLQPIALPNDVSIFVLHWHHMHTDKYTVSYV